VTRCLQFGVVALAVLLIGCGRTERVVRVVATDDHKPVTNRVFGFYPSAPFDLAPLIKSPPTVTAMLNSNGEAHVRFPRAHGWARFDDGEKSYGTSLKQADISRGGEFRLYGAPPTVDDSKIYPSRYVLQVRKP
jgi:hypothetical protein